MAISNNVFQKNTLKLDPDVNMDQSPPESAPLSRFRSSSSLDANAESPPKKQKVESADSKAQAVAAPHLFPPPVCSSSSSAELPASMPPFPRSQHARPPVARGRSRVAAADAPDGPQTPPPCPYQIAAEKTALKWTKDGTLFRVFAIGDDGLRPIALLGQGHSFQCFTIETTEVRWTDDGITFREFAIENEAPKSIALAGQSDPFQNFTIETSEGPKVVKLFKVTKIIKVFRLFVDSLTSRKQVGKGNAQILCDTRMELLKKNFEFCNNLGISCAQIRNVDTLKTDGYVLQDYAPEKVISWSQNSEELSNEQIAVLNQFLGVLKLAFMHHKQNFWDLYPRNFGLTSKGVTLFDFTDQPLEGMWLMFPNAIRAWAHDNPSAQKLIAAYLQECLTAPELNHVKEHIQTLITTLKWQ